jgi:cation diffusion facilitator family transporter
MTVNRLRSSKKMSSSIAPWQHDHVFDHGNTAGERSTRIVMWITAVMMAVEIAAGWMYNSMALLADGFHMSSHVIAIGLSAFAYGAARRHAADSRFAFGTWKIEILGGFASAVLLLAIAALMLAGSLERLVSPQPIHYQEAVAIAVVGLFVNATCAVLLGKAHHHGAGEHHDQAHHHDGHHHDLNLKSAYVHVLADAATSVFAIVALVAGWFLGWGWMDPVAGIAGAVLVAFWAKGLIAETGKVLLDREMDHPVVNEIRHAVRDGARPGSETRVTDLHVWRVGKAGYSCAISLVTGDAGLSPSDVRAWLSRHEEIVHSTIEIHHCEGMPPA